MEAGAARVTAFDLSGLVMLDGRAGKDLADVGRIGADCSEQREILGKPVKHCPRVSPPWKMTRTINQSQSLRVQRRCGLENMRLRMKVSRNQVRQKPSQNRSRRRQFYGCSA
jgi:hypothetical protein